MHSRIHASISYSFKKKIITFHASSNHPSYSTKSLKIISKKEKVSNDIFCLSLKNVRHSLGVCWQFKSKIQVLLLYIKTLCKAMVIDFFCHTEALCKVMVIDLFTSRPSKRQWSLISYVTSRPSTRQWSSISLHQDPLEGNGHWFLMSHRGPLRSNGHRSPYVKTLYEAMVINLFKSRPSTRQWSVISFLRWWPST